MADDRPYADEVCLDRAYADQHATAGFERRRDNLRVALALIAEWPNVEQHRDEFVAMLRDAADRLDVQPTGAAG